jgi:hypothetical protein
MIATWAVWVPASEDEDDNPHVCIRPGAENQPCLTCRLIELFGDDRRSEALDLAASLESPVR